MRILSLVIARKGSKGLKNKCIREIGGKPVFEYVIKYSVALNRKVKGGVHTAVSSDSPVIKKYCARKNIPFVFRDRFLSSDLAQVEDVIFDAYSKTGGNFEYISLLYGNIPTRYSQEFIKAYNFLEKNNDFDAAISMQKVEKYNPAWMFLFNEKILPARKGYQGYRRQDLKPYMIHDGHTLLFRARYFLDYMRKGRLKHKKELYEAFGKKIKPILNNKPIIDIDTGKDLELARAVILAG